VPLNVLNSRGSWQRLDAKLTAATRVPRDTDV
jgi:hypothetical protein